MNLIRPLSVTSITPATIRKHLHHLFTQWSGFIFFIIAWLEHVLIHVHYAVASVCRVLLPLYK